jgi:site-specific DNA-methyltransferase (adenine-specific)
LSEKTVAENVLKYGTGGINIEGCRVEAKDGVPVFVKRGEQSVLCYGDGLHGSNRTGEMDVNSGRFPANVIHDGSDEVVGMFPITKSGKAVLGTGTIDCQNHGIFGSGKGGIITSCFADKGSAARFFYCAKASKSERNEGLNGFPLKDKPGLFDDDNYIWDKDKGGHCAAKPRANHHPTVKPIALMRYLCKLVTPPNGIVLDPFMGSGTTGIAAKLEGFSFIGIEKEKEYFDIAEARINNCEQCKPDPQQKLF